MAITDNNFTPDELQAALTANPDLINHIKGTLTAKMQYVVQAPDEHENFKKHYEEQLMRVKTSEWAQNLERDVKEITGIDKADPNEKYYDYFKRATTTALGNMKKLEGELSELKSKANPSEADKARIAQLERGIQEKEAKIRETETTYKQKLFHLQAKAAIQADLAELRAKYRRDLPESVIQLVEKNAIETLMKQAKVQDDESVTFLDDKGEVIIDKASYKPERAAKLLEPHLKDILDEGRQQAGAGSNASTQGQTKTIQSGTFTWNGIPSDVRTQVELGAYLKKAGVLDGSKEWNEIFAKPEVEQMQIR